MWKNVNQFAVLYPSKLMIETPAALQCWHFFKNINTAGEAGGI